MQAAHSRALIGRRAIALQQTNKKLAAEREKSAGSLHATTLGRADESILGADSAADELRQLRLVLKAARMLEGEGAAPDLAMQQAGLFDSRKQLDDRRRKDKASAQERQLLCMSLLYTMCGCHVVCVTENTYRPTDRHTYTGTPAADTGARAGECGTGGQAARVCRTKVMLHMLMFLYM